MPATLQNLIQAKLTRDAQASQAIERYRRVIAPQPEPEAPQAPQETPAWLAEAFAQLDSLSARCDALIERNGRWTRYITGGSDVA